MSTKLIVDDVLIRPYSRDDRAALLRLAADTAFFGEPVEHYLDDRRLFCDGMYAYYTDFEPAHAWVACANGAVVGFLVACVDSSARRRRWVTQILPRLARGFLRARYALGARTYRHALRTISATFADGGPEVDVRRYPAHLHLNVHAAWRHRGIGRRLLVVSLDQLCALRVRGVHLQTTSLNIAAGKLYESVGFRIADARPSSQWSGIVPGLVTKVIYVRELACAQNCRTRLIH